jgi:hypothetical protein
MGIIMNLLKNNFRLLNTIIKKSKKIFKNKKIRALIFFLLIMIIFSFTFRQAPIYNQNQHTKFLHGLAQAGYGNLKNDWLANTIDPLPVFTFLIFLTAKFLNKYFFYLHYMIILGVFIFSIFKISDTLFFEDKTNIIKLLFFTIIITLHSVFLDTFFFRIFRYRITALLMENGVAQQHLLGSYFQPCVLGVFLLLSIFIFLKKKPFVAILFLGITSTFHSAYIFSSAILTLTYMIITFIEERNIKKVFLLGLFSLILVLPVLIYNFIYLGPTSQEISNKALDVFVSKRFAVHADPRKWIDIDAILKLIIIFIAALLTRKKRIFLIIIIPLSVGVLSTIFQLFFDNDLIGFLTPWRVSTWLVPLSTSVIVAYLLNLAFSKMHILNLRLVHKILLYCCFFMIFIHVSYGIYGTVKQFDEYVNNDKREMIKYVKENKSINDVYLIPPKLYDFRVNTGAPVFITYKSHPYKDIEILEWHRRVELSKRFYNKSDENKCAVLANIRQDYKITHVILQEEHFDIKFDCLEEIYKDNEYGVYKIR